MSLSMTLTKRETIGSCNFLKRVFRMCGIRLMFLRVHVGRALFTIMFFLINAVKIGNFHRTQTTNNR